MASIIEDHRRVMGEFIELYKFEPCLWRIKCKEYHDRAKREAAYRKLVEKLKEIEPSANKDAVVKKINNLRSNVRKEKKKYENSIKSGTSSDYVYHPKLWYYHLFDFVVDQETPRRSTSNLDSDEEISSESNSAQETQNSHVFDDPDSPSRQGPSTIDNAGSSTETENVQCSSGRTNPVTSRSRPGKQKLSQDSLTNDVLVTVRDHFKRPCIQEDCFDMIGKTVAVKLRGMDKRQSLIAEKIINDVIFEAELGDLTLQHKCVNMQERYVSSPLYSYSSSSSPIITPTSSPSHNFIQHSQSQQLPHTSPTQHYPQYQINQQSSKNVVVMGSSTEDSAAMYINTFTDLE